MSSTNQVYILGVGMTAFTKPKQDNDYVEMAHEAGVKAMLDAHVTYDDIQRGVACYCYGDSTCGQRVFYTFGMTQIPIINVNNNCATGSTGLALARDFIRAGLADCVLVLGFEKMAPGSLSSNFNDRTDPLDRAKELMNTAQPSASKSTAPFAVQMFANAALEYMSRYGAKAGDFAEVARVNHEHSQRNPYSQFKKEYSAEEIHGSAMIHEPLTKLQCCPTSDGAAAAVVVSRPFLDKRPRQSSRAIEIMGQSLVSDSPALFSGSAMSLVGYEMVKAAASAAYEEAGVVPAQVKVAEVHDCFSTNQVLVMDATGICEQGKAHEYVRAGHSTYGTAHTLVNPSGGLLSKGHPLGATGLAQCAELVWQLRGWASNRHVPLKSGQVALQQNAGLGGACVVTILGRADRKENHLRLTSEVASVSEVGYNPATEARGITEDQDKMVRSKKWSAWASARSRSKVDGLQAVM